MSSCVHYSVVDRVATVTLNRPDTMNALNAELKPALRDTLLGAAEDTGVRAVVLTGNGRAFCVGQDLGEHRDNLDRSTEPGDVWSTVVDDYAPIATALATMPKPVVAAVNGMAAGAGAAFAFACDFRIVSRTAAFNMAFAAIGLSVDSGLSWTLPRLVGLAKAKELLLLPRTVSAAEALDLGLATRVVEPDAVLADALDLARELAQGPTTAYGAIRRALAFSAAHPFEDALRAEAELMTVTGRTHDHRNAVRAFLAKENPTFDGV